MKVLYALCICIAALLMSVGLQSDLWQTQSAQIVLIVSIFVTTVAVVHILLFKTNSLSALLWIVFVILFPLLGPLIYWVFGINRLWHANSRADLLQWTDQSVIAEQLPEGLSQQMPLLQVGGRITGAPWTTGCHLQLLTNGEEAFPAMLSAIDRAHSEVLLASYIFDRDTTGQRFVAALSAARKRGVRVCVLLDDAGRRYSFPSVVGLLAREGLEHRLFMPFRLFPPRLSINMRNHKKLLLIDQEIAFVGGMNIGDRQLVNGPGKHKTADLHFRLTGNVLEHLRSLYRRDWLLSGGEDPGKQPELPELKESKLDQPVAQSGSSMVRIVPDGPDEQLHHLAQLIAGVVSAAATRVVVITPYFLPNPLLVGALQSAALRGVSVTVIIPHVSNWPIVRWALNHGLRELLSVGVKVFEQAAPFAHTKGLLIDERYALLGSANIDARSLRLNYEIGVEVVDQRLVAELDQYVVSVLERSKPVTQELVSSRSFVVRIRDAIAGLLAPYL